MYAGNEKGKDGPDLAIVLADRMKRKPSAASSSAEGEGDGEGDGNDYGDVEDSAVDDMFAAMEKGDKATFKAALSDYVEACVQRQLDKGSGENEG